jgi:hypothetical protein
MGRSDRRRCSSDAQGDEAPAQFCHAVRAEDDLPVYAVIFPASTPAGRNRSPRPYAPRTTSQDILGISQRGDAMKCLTAWHT